MIRASTSRTYLFPAISLSALCAKDKREIRSGLLMAARDKAAFIQFTPRGYSVNKARRRPAEGSPARAHAISFFSGAGGLDIGVHLAGIDVLCAVDSDKQCIETLKANRIFSTAAIRHDSIANLTGADFSSTLKERRTDKLILIGGPPCQPFSKAGYWVTNNRRLGSLDPRNMIGHYLRLISELRPDGFILENVESLLHPTNAHVALSIEEFACSLGYNLIRYRADALDFGVPQRRRRVFFIASLKPITGAPKPTHGPDEINGSKIQSLPYERAIDWIGQFDTPEYAEPGESLVGQTYSKEASQIPPGRNYFALTERDGHPSPCFKANTRFWSFLLKLHPLEPSWTIPAQPGPWVGPLHWNNRRLRAAEIAALQTFPADYVLTGSRRAVQRQIGNAVPPLLARAMVRFLLQHL